MNYELDRTYMYFVALIFHFRQLQVKLTVNEKQYGRKLILQGEMNENDITILTWTIYFSCMHFRGALHKARQPLIGNNKRNPFCQKIDKILT